jgi:hypothetical protein
MKFFRHITIGGIHLLFQKFWGSTFPTFFSRYRFANLRESCPRPRKKLAKKIFGAGPPWAAGLSLNGGKMTLFEFSHASTGHSFQTIDTKFFKRIALLLEKSPLKNLGGRTPLGEIFSPNFFSRYRSENLCVSCPGPRNSTVKKCSRSVP